MKRGGRAGVLKDRARRPRAGDIAGGIVVALAGLTVWPGLHLYALAIVAGA